MKKVQSSTVIVMMLFSLFINTAGPAQAKQAASPASIGTDRISSTVHSVFLPLVLNNATVTTPSSVQLIDKAVAAGTISAETGLIYKVFATFSDPRLPSQYIGAGVGRDGDGVIDEVVAQAKAGTLSASALQTLTPFFVPPDHAGSWYGLQSGASAQEGASSASADWVGIKTNNGKVWIIYLSTDAAAAAKAPGLKAAIDGKIWSKLTNLMGRAPIPDSSGYLRIYLWNSYIDSDGTAVPFDANTLGITVGTNCDQTATVIYLPSRLSLGDETHAGMIQYATHEMMHAIQFGGMIQNCAGYIWLKEATATWAEDYVYPDANSEWGTAQQFMDHPDWFLDANADMHNYGAYLLPYFLTHQIGDDSIIRKMWENAATESNSYLAVKNALPSAWQDYFWAFFLESLWNKAPFQEYYKTKDSLVNTVKAESDQVISAAGGEQVILLNGDFVTGGAMFYHFTVDSSVDSLTILNGLGKNLSKGQASLDDTVSGDQIYQAEALSDSDAAGATLIALMKVAGSTWQAIILGGTGAQLESNTHCIDVQGKIEELVIIQSNGDFAHPDTRTISPKGLPTTLFANNMPCWKVAGSSSYTIYNAGVTKVFSTTNAVYSYPNAVGDFSQAPYTNDFFAYPFIHLYLLSADVNWTVSGTDSLGCVYSGNGSFHVSEPLGVGVDSIRIYNGVMPDSPTYRGYAGQGIAENGTTITYYVTGENCPGSETDYDAPAFLEIPLADDRAAIKVPGGGGTLSGSYKRDEPSDDYEQMEWNLTPQMK